MRKISKGAATLVAALLLAGCATAPKSNSPEPLKVQGGRDLNRTDHKLAELKQEGYVVKGFKISPAHHTFYLGKEQK